MIYIYIYIRIGSNITSSAIWCKQVRVNFSKTTKLHEPVERVHIVVLKNLLEVMLLPIHIYIYYYRLVATNCTKNYVITY